MLQIRQRLSVSPSGGALAGVAAAKKAPDHAGAF